MTDTKYAVRCAKLAREARRTGDVARAIRLEQSALRFAGSEPSQAWNPETAPRSDLGSRVRITI